MIYVHSFNAMYCAIRGHDRGSIVAELDGLRANDLAFSCRERVGHAFKIPTISREAVSCNAGLGRRFACAVRLNQDLGRDA